MDLSSPTSLAKAQRERRRNTHSSGNDQLLDVIDHIRALPARGGNRAVGPGDESGSSDQKEVTREIESYYVFL